jgi:hypothetical protein
LKKIIFTYDSEHAQKFFEPPKPATKFLPDWYKNSKRIQGDESKAGLDLDNPWFTNTTVKACMPFLDALTTGYIWSLPLDLEFRKTKEGISIRWRDDFTHVSTHTKEQTQLIPIPAQSKNSFVFKWSFNFHIKTPKGYSCLFTHPLNRNDLPFRTFSGVVDTDNYPIDVQFPFQVLTETFDELLIVEKGTPVVQFMPFLRDNWINEVNFFNKYDADKRGFNFMAKIQKSYQNHFWSKKSYR